MATIKTTVVNDGCIRVAIALSTPKSTYKRKLTWKYKLSTAKTWDTWTSKTLNANTTYNSGADNLQANVGGTSDQRLTPGKTYNFQVILKNVTTGKDLQTLSASAATTAAAGVFTVSATPTQITATVTGLKSTAYYGRNIRFYLDRGLGWEYWGEKYIAPNVAAGTPTFRINSGIYMGEMHRIKAELWRGTKESPETKYKDLGIKSIVVPWSGISIPKINSVVHESPSGSITVNWGLASTHVDTVDTTKFTFKIRRENGTVVNGGTLTGRSVLTKTIDCSSWMLEDETISVWIEATEPNTAAKAQSPEYEIKVGRLFHWDTEKVAGEEFNVTASEWNRMVNYVNAAAAMYPDYFTAIEDGLVSSGAELTAELANKALGGFYTLSHGQVTREVTIALPAMPDLSTGIHLEFTFLDSSPHVVNWYEIDIVSTEVYRVPIYPPQGCGAIVRYVNSSNSILITIQTGMAPGTPGIATIEGSFVGATNIAQHGTVSADQIVQIEQKLISAMHEATGL